MDPPVFLGRQAPLSHPVFIVFRSSAPSKLHPPQPEIGQKNSFHPAFSCQGGDSNIVETVCFPQLDLENKIPEAITLQSCQRFSGSAPQG